MKRLFTLLELMIVIAIMGILISILLPSLVSSRERAKLAVCLSNNRQLNIMTQIFINHNRGLMPSNAYTNQGIKSLYWMAQINMDWKTLNDIEVRGTAFECTSFAPIKKENWREDSIYQWLIGGIGYNRYIGGEADRRHPQDKHSPTFTANQIVRPAETLVFADTLNDIYGSGGPAMIQQTTQPAHGNVEKFVKRHMVFKGPDNWLPTSWVDGHGKIMSATMYHKDDFNFMYWNAIG